MRAFIGLGPPDTVRDALDGLQSDLRVGRLVDPENLHLTLAFLGEVDLPTLEALHLDLQQITFAPFDLRLAGLELFGGARPRVLSIRGQAGPPLRALRAKLHSTARGAGIDLPRARFRPHVTLARFRRDMPPDDTAKLGRFLSAHADVALPAFPVEAFTLYRSHLSPDGATYEPLADYPVPA